MEITAWQYTVESTIHATWKYTLKSTVHGTGKQYEKYSIGLLMQK